MSVGEISAYVLAAVLAAILCRVFFKPLKSVFIMIFQSVFGGACLYILNFVLAPFGVSLGINMVTAAFCGLFGLPAFVLLLILKIVYAF